MTYYADPSKDLPVPWKSKRIVIYAQGLKIYGQIPYILQRRLQAQFISNSMSCLGSRIVAPSGEDNYTIIPWRRVDGEQHTITAMDALLDWLYTDKGFEVAVATRRYFYDRLDLPNMWQSPPHVFIPTLEQSRSLFRLALTSGKIERQQAIDLVENQGACSS